MFQYKNIQLSKYPPLTSSINYIAFDQRIQRPKNIITVSATLKTNGPLENVPKNVAQKYQNDPRLFLCAKCLLGVVYNYKVNPNHK